MHVQPSSPDAARTRIAKAPTGITGFDQLTDGGLPRGRTTLVCGGPGCGKSLFAAEFLLRTAREQGEAAVLVSFEESEAEITMNLASLGYDVPALIEQGLLIIDHIVLDAADIEETGAYGLDGLFVRLGHAVDTVGATRIALDTIEVLFAGLRDTDALRNELRRLFTWLKERGLTVVVTAERGEGSLTRHGIEEYVSDCVLLLEHDLEERIATRRLRVVKYRGTGHGTDRYPFVITDGGFEVVPASSMLLDHPALHERVSTGVAALDELLGGEGIHRGATVLVSGQAGTGKSSLAMSLALATVARGERCLYLAFEESPAQIIRNMASLGMDVERAVESGLLTIEARRPTAQGLETLLAQISSSIRQLEPATVVLDPITAIEVAGEDVDVRLMIMRLVDLLKGRGITTMMVSLISGIDAGGDDDVGISSLVDTWLLLRNLEHGGERNRGLYVLKSRGTAHSNQIREFVLGEGGIDLLPVAVRDGEVLVGSARAGVGGIVDAEVAQLAADEQRAREALDAHRQVTDARIALMEVEHRVEAARIEREVGERARLLSRQQSLSDDETGHRA